MSFDQINGYVTSLQDVVRMHIQWIVSDIMLHQRITYS